MALKTPYCENIRYENSSKCRKILIPFWFFKNICCYKGHMRLNNFISIICYFITHSASNTQICVLSNVCLCDVGPVDTHRIL